MEKKIKATKNRNSKSKLSTDKNKKDGILKVVMPVLKGTIVGLVFSVVCILIFAFVIKLIGVNDSLIPPVNQFIKIAGILIATFFAMKSDKRIFVGILTGCSYILFSFLLFSIVQGQLGLFNVLFSDLLMGAIMGTILGALISKKFTASTVK